MNIKQFQFSFTVSSSLTQQKPATMYVLINTSHQTIRIYSIFTCGETFSLRTPDLDNTPGVGHINWLRTLSQSNITGDRRVIHKQQNQASGFHIRPSLIDLVTDGD